MDTCNFKSILFIRSNKNEAEGQIVEKSGIQSIRVVDSTEKMLITISIQVIATRTRLSNGINYRTVNIALSCSVQFSAISQLINLEIRLDRDGGTYLSEEASC